MMFILNVELISYALRWRCLHLLLPC